MKRILSATFVILTICTFGSAHASFQNNGNGFIYDTDINITWYAVANNTSMTWNAANTWAASLNVAGVSGWRLPSALNIDGSGPNSGYVIGSEMGHLFSWELEGGFGTPITSIHNSNFDLFSNLQSAIYWSGTQYDQGSAWFTAFMDGNQFTDAKTRTYYALAVHSGEVVAPVPIPAAVWLLGSGLIGLVGLRRFKK
jgi:hypothetical protein